MLTLDFSENSSQDAAPDAAAPNDAASEEASFSGITSAFMMFGSLGNWCWEEHIFFSLVSPLLGAYSLLSKQAIWALLLSEFGSEGLHNSCSLLTSSVNNW